MTGDDDVQHQRESPIEEDRHDAPGATAEPEKPAPLTIAEAFELIRSTAPAIVFRVLKDNKFVSARERVFAGFRVTPDTLRTSLARGRMATELLNDSRLANAILDLVGHAARGPKIPEGPPRTATPTPSSAPPKEQHKVDRVAQLTVERDRLKREIQNAQQQAKSTGDELRQAQQEVTSLRAELAAAGTQLGVEQRQGSWRERRLRRMERELSEVRNAVAGTPRCDGSAPVQHTVESSQNERSKQAEYRSQSIIIEALERLLSRRKTEAVSLVVEEILQQDGGDIVARRIRALVRIAQGKRVEALDDLRFVFDAYRVSGDLASAARTVVQTAIVLGEPDRKMAHSLYASVSKRQDLAPAVAEVLAGIIGSPTYEALRALCAGALAERLFLEPGIDSAATALPRELVQSLGNISPQRLVQAIDRNEERMVTAARLVVHRLDKSSRELLESSLSVIANQSYFQLLTRRELTGPAIIDGSNVANYELDLMATDRPLLSSVLSVRHALRMRGYFPVITIIDANLPYMVDQTDVLKNLIERGEIEAVAGGTDADEVIVSEARRLGAVVITNDYMVDWDPAGEVEKVQYTVSLTDGRATLYF